MKWNNHGLKVGSIVIILLLILSGCGGAVSNGGGSGDSKVYELNVNNTASSMSSFGTDVFEPWKKLVEEKTNGRVKVNLYHGGSLGGSTTVLNDVKGGVYDVCLVWSPYEVDSELFPVTVGDLPFAMTKDLRVNNSIINQYAQKNLVNIEEDVMVMGVSAAVPSYLFSSKPITKMKDLKNKKIRAVGKNEASTIESWGAVPVSVPVEELYDALQKGIIDVVNTSVGMALDSSLHEVTPYMLNIPYKAIQMVPVLNKAFYERLPDDLKTLFKDELNPAMVELVLETNINDSSKTKDEFVKIVESKGKLTHLSDAEEKSLTSTAKTVWETWIEDANKKGYQGEEMMKDYQSALKSAGGEVPFE